MFGTSRKMSHSVPQARNLPPQFAIMRPTSGGGPSYQLCSSTNEHILSTRLGVLDLYFQSIENIQSEILNSSFTVEEVPNPTTRSMYTVSLRNANHPVNDIRKIKWWFSSHNLKTASGEVIPVVGTTRRFFLMSRFHRIVPQNRTQSEMQEIYRQYDSIRQGFLASARPQVEETEDDWVPREPPRRLAAASPPIPAFVCQLLVKNAIEKHEACPITLQPIAQLSSLGITPCFHLFDFSSIEQWANEHHKCPSCRAALRTILLYEAPPT